MGVSQMKKFITENVPSGTFPINMKDEIRKYFSTSKLPNPPPPIIVVDLMCLAYPFCGLDTAGIVCGGRFNEIARCMDQFFGEFTSAGAELVFFWAGPVRSTDEKTWCRKKETYYSEMLQIFDAVDDGEELLTIAKFRRLPFHYICTLKQVAMKHGRHYWATAKQCDQQIVAYANKSNALAIFSDDSDFFIYEGSWRLWCMSKLDIKNLTTVEYDREGIMNCLGLQRGQMPLLATLVGNDVVSVESLKRFHQTLGNIYKKLSTVAHYIRANQAQPVEQILTQVLDFCSNRRELMTRFKDSLSSYQVECKPFNLKHLDEPVETFLLSRNISLFYQMWHSKSIECTPGVIDLRHKVLGKDVVQLIIFLILRMGGIVLYQRQMQRRIVDYSECHAMIKLNHESDHALHRYFVDFPTNIKPPRLEELLSNDPVTCSDLQDIKTKLFCWVASDALDHRRLEAIPKALQPTILTLYCLVERRIIERYEADLLLQVAHDVTYSKYDPQAVSYPRKLGSRPFRVAFAYQKVYAYVGKAFNLVGLTTDMGEDPPFDGVLFHNWYEDWSRQLVVSSLSMEWRLYESIAEDDAD